LRKAWDKRGRFRELRTRGSDGHILFELRYRETPEPERDDNKVHEQLDEPEMLAVSTLGRLTKNPRVAALRRFISNWYVSYLSVDDARGQPEAGAQERLSKTGDNLANYQ